MEIYTYLKEFDRELDSNLETQVNQYAYRLVRNQFRSLFKTDIAKAFEFFTAFRSCPFLEEMFYEAVELEYLCLQSFLEDYKKTKPEIYNELVTLAINSLLTKADRQKASKPLAFLAWKGSQYFLEQGVYLKITAPHRTGSSNKGRVASLPQRNAVFLVYNPEAILSGTTEYALVYDGTFIEYSIKETRAKLIKNNTALYACKTTGFYKHGQHSYPVEGCEPSWVSVFRSFLRDFLRKLDDCCSNIVDESKLSQICLDIKHKKSLLLQNTRNQAEAFYCGLTPPEFYRRFMQQPFVRTLFADPVVKDYYEQHLLDLRSHVSFATYSVVREVTSTNS